MDKTDLEVIESLSEPAKKLFYSLDRNSQKRMLKKAKELAIRNRDREKIKEKKIKQLQVQNEKQKKQKMKRQGVDVHISVGSYQTVLGLVGDTSQVDKDLVASLNISL